MNIRRRIISVFVIVVFVFGIFLLQETFAAEKIAFVDLGLIFDGYVKTKDFDSRLEDIQKEKQNEIDGRVEKIKALQDKLSVVSDRQKEKKQKEIDRETKELQEFQRDSEMELLKERDAKLKDILKDIQEVVEGLAKKKGYSLIMNNRVLLYGKPSLDVSKAILKQLNSDYKKKKR